MIPGSNKLIDWKIEQAFLWQDLDCYSRNLLQTTP